MANPSKVLSRVTAVEPCGEGVYHVVFSVPTRYTRYIPGQFLHLTLEEFDPTTGFWPESRVFSIASKPREDHVSIVYSVKGAYTKRLEAELSVGREVWLKFPYGDFIIDQSLQETGSIVLVAGGTGISPYLPFLFQNTEFKGTVHLFYGVRKPEHILFPAKLAGLDTSWFRLHLSIEEGDTAELPFTRGRLSVPSILTSLGAEQVSASYFLSGPPVMIRNFQSELIANNLTAKQIHIDEWE